MADDLKWLLSVKRFAFYRAAARLRAGRKLLQDREKAFSETCAREQHLAAEKALAEQSMASPATAGCLAAWGRHAQHLAGRQRSARQEKKQALESQRQHQGQVDECLLALFEAVAGMNAADELHKRKKRTMRLRSERRAEDSDADDRLAARVRNPDTVSGNFGHRSPGGDPQI